MAIETVSEHVRVNDVAIRHMVLSERDMLEEGDICLCENGSLMDCNGAIVGTPVPSPMFGVIWFRPLEKSLLVH